MKYLRQTLFALPLLCAFMLYSCSSSTQEMEAAVSPSPALDVYGSPDPACCAQCGNTCILGSDFSQHLKGGGSHPQGSYQVITYTGDCRCTKVNGVWTVATNGPVTQQNALWGGPGSGAVCNQPLGPLLGDLFGNFCAGVWISDNGLGDDPYGSWGQWTTGLLDSLQSIGDSIVFGQPTFGVINGPSHWGIDVYPIDPQGPIRISLPGTPQANQLEEIEVFVEGVGDPVSTIRADGSLFYDIDLTGFPNGMVTFKLDFWPSFYVTYSVQKTPASS